MTPADHSWAKVSDREGSERSIRTPGHAEIVILLILIVPAASPDLPNHM